MDDTLNLAQAAAILYAEPETVSKLARCGELPATQIGRGWVFMRNDVLAFLQDRIRKDTEDRRTKNMSDSTPRAFEMELPKRRPRRRTPPALPDLPSPINKS